MKLIDTTTANITAVEFDECSMCYYACIDKEILVPVYNGIDLPIEYKKRNLCYLEFSLINVSELEEGDTITIETYEHSAGERTDLVNGGEYIFTKDGIHNIVTQVIHHSTDEGCIMLDDDDLTPDIDYDDDDFDEEAYNAMMRDQAEEFKEAEKSMIAQNYLRDYTKPCALDPNEEGASNSFAGALVYASNVFMNRLILGGAYSTNQDDKMIILEHLKAIMDIIEKYQK